MRLEGTSARGRRGIVDHRILRSDEGVSALAPAPPSVLAFPLSVARVEELEATVFRVVERGPEILRA